MLGAEFEPLKTAPAAVAESLILKQIDTLEPLVGIEMRDKKDSKGEPPFNPKTFVYKTLLQTRAANPEEVKTARELVIQMGLNADHVKTWSPLHVVLIDDIMHYEQFRDELGKLMNRPTAEAKPGMDEALTEINVILKKWSILALVPWPSKK